MRTNVLLTLTLGFLLSLSAFGQSKTDRAAVKWGPELSDKTDGVFSQVVGYNDEHVYMLMRVKKEVFLQKMNSSHKSIYKKLIPFKIGKEEHSSEGVVVLTDRILVFSSFMDKKTKTNTLYMRVFNESNMAPMGKMQKMASFDVEKKRNTGSFSVTISPNEKVVLVYLNLPFEKDDNERFSLKVYDMEMSPMWDREVSLPYLDSEFGVQSLRVTDDGSVVMVGTKYAEKREAKELKKDGKSSYVYHLLVYKSSGDEPGDYPINVEDKFLQDLTLNIGSEGDILCGGLYGKKGTFTTAGTFFLNIDRETKQLKHSSFKEFDRDFITAYMTEKEEAKATKKAARKGEDLEMYNFELRDIIRREDGGAVMIAEQYYMYAVTTCTTNSNGGQTCRTTYHYIYNDIIVVNVDPEGNIEWASKIPKRQHSVNDGGYYSSYAVSVKGDNIYLLFNDNGKNLFLTQGAKVEPFKYGKDMLITLATIDGDGRVYREALLSQEKRDAMTRPKSGVQIGDDRLFIYATWKKNYRFGTVTFN